MEKYEDMKVGELKKLAKKKGIKGFSTMKKAALVDALVGGPVEAPVAPAGGAVDVRPASVRMKKVHSGGPIDIKGMKTYEVTGGITGHPTSAPIAVKAGKKWVNVGAKCVDRGETVKLDPNGDHTKRWLAIGVIK